MKEQFLEEQFNNIKDVIPEKYHNLWKANMDVCYLGGKKEVLGDWQATNKSSLEEIATNIPKIDIYKPHWTEKKFFDFITRKNNG